MSDKPEREHGERWRVLAHRGDEKIELEDQGTFDELVLEDWLHVEQMDKAVWWLRVGDARLTVTLQPAGPPTLDVERGFHAVPNGTTNIRE